MITFPRTSLARIVLALLMAAVGTTQALAKKKHHSDDVILIYNVEELQNIQNNLSGNYHLANDIPAAGFNFTPIGDDANAFTGAFNGNGFAIKNVTISSSSDAVGVFANVGPSATVSNVRLLNANITATATSGNVGSLVGINSGRVYAIYATGAVSALSGGTGGDFSVGGLVGGNGGFGASISNSSVNVRVTTSNGVGGGGPLLYVGGLLGGNCQGTVSDSSASGSVTAGASADVGGLVGVLFCSSGGISQSWAAGSVQGGDGSSVGGLLGNNYDAGVRTSYATGRVIGTNGQIGGLVGLNGGTTPYPSVYDSFSYGSVTAKSNGSVGGLIGTMNQATVEGSLSYGKVQGHGGYVGGLIGSLIGGQTISATYWDLDASGVSDPSAGCGNVPNCSGVVGLRTKNFVGKIPGGLATDPAWVQVNFPFRSDYPKLWAPSFPITAFPLTGYTPYSIPIISVFDHSQQDSPNSGIGRLYACDQVVRAFDGSTGELQYGADAPQCKQPGYKQQSGKNFVLGGVNYVGLPAKYLEYDGHPGYDLAASLQTPVYAAVSGTIFYPWRAVGSGSNNDTYCRFHALGQIPDIAPTYRLYYLHLYTHPAKKGQTNPDCLSSKDTDGQTVSFTSQPNCYTDLNGNPINPTMLPLPEGTHANAGCEIALSGDAGVPGAPHLHFEVQQMVRADGFPGNKDNMKYFACYDERKSYKQGLPSIDPYCLAADPYGWTGSDPTNCPAGDPLHWTGDIWQCLTGIPSRRFWAQ